jgi:hypothetical protein
LVEEIGHSESGKLKIERRKSKASVTLFLILKLKLACLGLERLLYTIASPFGPQSRKGEEFAWSASLCGDPIACPERISAPGAFLGQVRGSCGRLLLAFPLALPSR